MADNGLPPLVSFSGNATRGPCFGQQMSTVVDLQKKSQNGLPSEKTPDGILIRPDPGMPSLMSVSYFEPFRYDHGGFRPVELGQVKVLPLADMPVIKQEVCDTLDVIKEKLNQPNPEINNGLPPLEVNPYVFSTPSAPTPRSPTSRKTPTGLGGKKSANVAIKSTASPSRGLPAPPGVQDTSHKRKFDDVKLENSTNKPKKAKTLANTIAMLKKNLNIASDTSNTISSINSVFDPFVFDEPPSTAPSTSESLPSPTKANKSTPSPSPSKVTATNPITPKGKKKSGSEQKALSEKVQLSGPKSPEVTPEKAEQSPSKKGAKKTPLKVVLKEPKKATKEAKSAKKSPATNKSSVTASAKSSTPTAATSSTLTTAKSSTPKSSTSKTTPKTTTKGKRKSSDNFTQLKLSFCKDKDSNQSGLIIETPIQSEKHAKKTPSKSTPVKATPDKSTSSKATSSKSAPVPTKKRKVEVADKQNKSAKKSKSAEKNQNQESSPAKSSTKEKSSKKDKKGKEKKEKAKKSKEKKVEKKEKKKKHDSASTPNEEQNSSNKDEGNLKSPQSKSKEPVPSEVDITTPILAKSVSFTAVDSANTSGDIPDTSVDKSDDIDDVIIVPPPPDTTVIETIIIDPTGDDSILDKDVPDVSTPQPSTSKGPVISNDKSSSTSVSADTALSIFLDVSKKAASAPSGKKTTEENVEDPVPLKGSAAKSRVCGKTSLT